MSELAPAAVLAVTILIASTVSVEIGLGRRLEPRPGRDRRPRPVDHEPRGGLRGAGRDRPQPLSTGLTFRTITPLYGLQSGIIDCTQFSLLLTVLSAIVPTAIAQRFFQPHPGAETAPTARALAVTSGRPVEGET